MEEIQYSRHASLKFGILERHGFPVTKDQVETVVRSPEGVHQQGEKKFIAQRAITDSHLLRVVYRKEADVIVIITFYPGRRERYENTL